MFKKLFLSILMVGLFVNVADARMDVNVRQLRISGVRAASTALTSGAAQYSDGIRIKGNVGYMSLLITEDISGGAGDVDISVEYSIDNVNWYTANYTPATMDGTVSAEANIRTALQNSTEWIVFPPRLSPYVRFKFDPDANSEITAYLIYQELD